MPEKSKKMVMEYVVIAFLLLGALFGMMIMSFIFGTLGNSDVNTISDQIVLNNVTSQFINSTGYSIPESSNSNFNGGVSVISAWNGTNNAIASGNYTVIANVIYNKTAQTFTNVTFNYSFYQMTNAKIITSSIQNSSLSGIQAYSNQSTTQFNTVSIAIVLIILIGIFLLFWKIFVDGKKSRHEKEYSGGNFA